MTDFLVRDIPDDVLRRLDARAAKLGLSRSAYVRRRLAQETAESVPLNRADLERFAETFGDLGDPEVMRGAWD